MKSLHEKYVPAVVGTSVPDVLPVYSASAVVELVLGLVMALVVQWLMLVVGAVALVKTGVTVVHVMVVFVVDGPEIVHT